MKVMVSKQLFNGTWRCKVSYFSDAKDFARIINKFVTRYDGTTKF